MHQKILRIVQTFQIILLVQHSVEGKVPVYFSCAPSETECQERRQSHVWEPSAIENYHHENHHQILQMAGRNEKTENFNDLNISPDRNETSNKPCMASRFSSLYTPRGEPRTDMSISPFFGSLLVFGVMPKDSLLLVSCKYFVWQSIFMKHLIISKNERHDPTCKWTPIIR